MLAWLTSIYFLLRSTTESTSSTKEILEILEWTQSFSLFLKINHFRCVSLTKSNANDDHKLNIAIDKESILFCCMFMVRCKKRLFKLRQHLNILSAFDKRETWCNTLIHFRKYTMCCITLLETVQYFNWISHLLRVIYLTKN